MHSPDDLDDALTATLDLRIAERNLRIEAPGAVMAVLERTLANVPRFGARRSPDLTVVAAPGNDLWEIRGIGGNRNVLAARSALPHVAGAIVSLAINDVAASCGYRTMRATVLERHGRAFAMIGDDWESAIALATHFHGRGWRYIGSDRAMVDPATHHVYCVQKSLYVNASSVAQLPVRYRGAVESSPWYVTAHGISFYAVDPSLAGMAQPAWAAQATLGALLLVDGAMADRPSIESIDAERLGDRVTRFGIATAALPAANLHIGGYVETVDLIEHWFASILA